MITVTVEDVTQGKVADHLISAVGRLRQENESVVRQSTKLIAALDEGLLPHLMSGQSICGLVEAQGEFTAVLALAHRVLTAEVVRAITSSTAGVLVNVQLSHYVRSR